jgi:hypothetical protein
MGELKVTHSRCKCPGCHRFFNSTAAFDKHRIGMHGKDRRCMTAEEMIAKGMDKNSDGYWITALMPSGFSYQDEESQV